MHCWWKMNSLCFLHGNMRSLCHWWRDFFSSVLRLKRGIISVCFRGKGDYHRLGHGTDDHVRRPRRVTALASKKVVAIACGSLHCVACTDQGKLVFLISISWPKQVDLFFRISVRPFIHPSVRLLFGCFATPPFVLGRSFQNRIRS